MATTAATMATTASPIRQFGLLFRAQLQRSHRPSQSQPTRLRRYASSSTGGKRAPSGRKAESSNSDASSSSSSPRTLEKPDKFRPPSHPARLAGRKASPIRNYGPELTADERAAQRTKRYPNSMPPDGSWMHWFLTNRTIHLWITMTFLFGTGLWAFVLNIRQNSPFAHMLPPAGDLLWHPLDSIYQALQVYKITAEHQSRVTAEKRRVELEEVQRRKAYRIAHGLDSMDGIDEADPIFAAALASRLEREAREKDAALAVAGENRGGQGEASAGDGTGSRKKWLGIW